MGSQLINSVINSEDNSIVLRNHSKTIDIRMKLRQVDANGVVSDVQFTQNTDGEDNVFVALFDGNDIDFQIQFDNMSIDKRRVAFIMTYGKHHEFIANYGFTTLRSVRNSSHHLRFLSPNKSMANLFVDLVPKEGILCSQIGFAFEAEKERPKIDDNQKMTIKVQTLNQKIIELKISPNEMISDVNEMIYESQGIPQDMQRLLIDDKELEEDKSVSDYGIEEGSTIHMIVKVRSGGQSRSDREFIADQNIQMTPFSIELRIKGKQ